MAALKIKRVLTPTDTSEASRVALDYARLFVEKFSAELIVLYADPLAYPIDIVGMPAIYAASAAEDPILLEQEVRAFAVPSLQGTPFQVVVTGGQPVPMILRYEREYSADLIVMATHGLRGWRRTILGSVTEGVLHGARCPVLSVSRSDKPPHTRPTITRIVCPINFTEVAREALRTAAQLVDVFGSELILVHVLEGDVERDAKKDEERVRRWIDPELQDRCTYREIVLRGGPAERILDCVEDLGADFLVIGAQHSLMRQETVIGTTTERLVRFARRPVLTVVRPLAATGTAR